MYRGAVLNAEQLYGEGPALRETHLGEDLKLIPGQRIPPVYSKVLSREY